MSSRVPALLLAPGVENERLAAAMCLRLRLDFSSLTSGDDSSLIGYWRVARGFGFLVAAPYSPIPGVGRHSRTNHQLSIFIGSCFSDVETIFSTAEKHAAREQDVLFL